LGADRPPTRPENPVAAEREARLIKGDPDLGRVEVLSQQRLGVECLQRRR
jgi:hypothetical protein